MNVIEQKAQIHYVILRDEESYQSNSDDMITRFFTLFRMTQVLFGWVHFSGRPARGERWKSKPFNK